MAGIWELVDGGADFDEVLDALIASGLRDLPGFVLVNDVDGTTKVVLRGPAQAVFTTRRRDREVEGTAASTWVERTLTGVRTMRIVVAESDEGDFVIDWAGAGRPDRPAGRTSRPRRQLRSSTATMSPAARGRRR